MNLESQNPAGVGHKVDASIHVVTQSSNLKGSICHMLTRYSTRVRGACHVFIYKSVTQWQAVHRCCSALTMRAVALSVALTSKLPAAYRFRV